VGDKASQCRRGAWPWATAVCIGLAVGAVACLPEDRCGPLQELEKETDLCVCVRGADIGRDNKCHIVEPEPDGGTSSPGDGGPVQSDGGCVQPAAPPAATGQSCQVNADCKNTGATWCAPDPAGPKCAIQGCSLECNDCPVAWKCCDMPLAPEGTLCIPEDVECPFG
jgi:hypothetical protein